MRCAGERYRLLWLQEAISFRNPLIEMLEENYQASVVVDELNDIYWRQSIRTILHGNRAEAHIISIQRGGGTKAFTHKKACGSIQIDGAINPCHWGCRQATGARGLIARALKELGVPVINLEVDCGDSRNFAEGQMRTRLEAFMELLGGIDRRRSRKTGGVACTV